MESPLLLADTNWLSVTQLWSSWITTRRPRNPKQLNRKTISKHPTSWSKHINSEFAHKRQLMDFSVHALISALLLEWSINRKRLFLGLELYFNRERTSPGHSCWLLCSGLKSRWREGAFLMSQCRATKIELRSYSTMEPLVRLSSSDLSLMQPWHEGCGMFHTPDPATGTQRGSRVVMSLTVQRTRRLSSLILGQTSSTPSDGLAVDLTPWHVQGCCRAALSQRRR